MLYSLYESITIFGDALRHLANQARFLHGDLCRCWYSMSASLKRPAADHAGQLEDALARVEFYYFTVLWFNSCQRTNEVTMRDNCRGVDIFVLEKVDEPVSPFLQNLFGLN